MGRQRGDPSLSPELVIARKASHRPESWGRAPPRCPSIPSSCVPMPPRPECSCPRITESPDPMPLHLCSPISMHPWPWRHDLACEGIAPSSGQIADRMPGGGAAQPQPSWLGVVWLVSISSLGWWAMAGRAQGQCPGQFGHGQSSSLGIWKNNDPEPPSPQQGLAHTWPAVLPPSILHHPAPLSVMTRTHGRL